MQTLTPTIVQQELPGKSIRCLKKESLEQDGLSLKSGVAEPVLEFDGVKIRVLATSVCGTDKSIYNSGKSEGIRREMQRYLPRPEDYKPIIVGHEFCGIVEEVGPGVTRDNWKNVPEHLLIEPGDYVTAEMHLSCGHCLLCRTGNEHICTAVKVKGVHLDGCFAQKVVVPYKNVVLLGKGGSTASIHPRIGALLDAFGNAVHTIKEADVAGKSVAILGAGPLGLMATFLAKNAGATRIYLTEAADVERRFALGTEFGADQCFDVSKGSAELYKSIEKHETGSNGVDVVLEMSGAPPAYKDAFSIIRNGGKVVLLGIAKEPIANFDIANGVIWKGVNVQGIFGRRMFDTWESMLRLIRSSQFNIKSQLAKVVSSREYALEEYKEAFDVLSSGKEMKLIFTPNGSLGI